MLELPFEPPVQQISHPLFAKKQVEVWMKREDLVHPFISGNKWRKLKYVLTQAREDQKKHLVSFGGAYSNHLVALACAGAMYGFKTTAFVRGEEHHNPILMLCRTWGMSLHFVSREAYRDKQELFDTGFGNDPGALFIDEGGRGEAAMRGCAEILDTVGLGFTHVFAAVGTGTTLAGLATGAARRNMQAEGICVLKGAEEIDNDVRGLIPQLHNWKIHHQLHRGGYAKTTDELMRFITVFAQETGILLDQVYTGKMVLGVFDLVRQDYFNPHAKLLLIHTGGLLGLLTQRREGTLLKDRGYFFRCL
jgi:1-aminocyclopropane-1-carboxylate deaminase